MTQKTYIKRMADLACMQSKEFTMTYDNTIEGEVPEDVLFQYHTPMEHFLTYVSRHKYPEVPMSLQNQRDMVWHFKNGNTKVIPLIAEMVIRSLKARYSFEELKEKTFVCIPASSPAKQQERYEYFSGLVCLFTGMQNGYNLINVVTSRLAIHETRLNGEKSIRPMHTFEIGDFKGRDVIIFDDVITKGLSFCYFSECLESAGASVSRAIFLAKTED